MRLMTAGILATALGLASTTAVADAPRTEVDTFEWSTASGSQLGLLVMGMTPELRGYFGAMTDRGVLVAHVVTDSPAARAGARVGDVIVAVRGHEVQGAGDVPAALAGVDRGVSFTIDIVRDHKMITLQAKIPKSRPTA